ncbi:NYN domain-containing protein [Methanocella sp. MCL-LM]|uniref:NYN domain-containing protein n=1 Tax=Methanocella sp. MCL-LM TaxID=3412035 RepID=UPI003C74B9D3
MQESSENHSTNKNIAMLIDGDNAQPSLIEEMLSEAGKYGNVTVRRIYGDWTMSSMNSWKDYLHKHAFQPIQQFRYTKGKNATDSAMIIDAMDILYAGHVDGFCIVSSDSDYTKLATRLRESGLFVMGIGRKDTPQSFVKACVIFTFVENLSPDEEETPEKTSSNHKAPSRARTHKKLDKFAVNLLKRAYEMGVGKEGEWVDLSTLANNLYKIEPSFDSREYGFSQLQLLVKATNLYDVERSRLKGPSQSYIRLK